MQQMGRTMVAYRIFTALLNHAGLYRIAHTHIALINLAVVDNQAPNWTLRVLHMEDTHRAGNIAPIGYLAATLGIEGRSIEYHHRLLWRTNALHLLPIHNQTNHLTTTGDT